MCQQHAWGYTIFRKDNVEFFTIPGAAFAVGPSGTAVATVAMLVPLQRGHSDQILHIFHIFHMFHEGNKF
jgi:hypothetical protein